MEEHLNLPRRFTPTRVEPVRMTDVWCTNTMWATGLMVFGTWTVVTIYVRADCDENRAKPGELREWVITGGSY